jgi:TIR domain
MRDRADRIAAMLSGGMPSRRALRTPGSRAAAEQRLKVFISHSHKDLDFVLRMGAALEFRGLAPKIDTRDLSDPEDWRRELLGFIREADAVVFIVSPHAISSPVCSWELEQIAKLNKPLAPIVLERVCDDFSPTIKTKFNHLFFDRPDDFGLQVNKLALALQSDLPWLKEHIRLGDLARRWDERKRAAGWTLRGRDLRQAEHWIASHPRSVPAPTELHREFIAQSRRAATRRQRLILAVSLAAAVVGFGLAWLAHWQRNQAMYQKMNMLGQLASVELLRLLSYPDTQPEITVCPGA